MKNARATRFRTALAVGHDLVAASLAWVIAYWLRFNLVVPADYGATMWRLVLPVAALQVAVLSFMGVYRGLWRYASLHDLRQLVTSIVLGSLGVTAMLALLAPHPGVPRTVLILQPLVALVLMGGGRLLYRFWKEGYLRVSTAGALEPVVILGAGSAGERLTRELIRSAQWRPVALLDDDARKWNRRIHGVAVRGPVEAVASLADELEAKTAIIAIPSAPHAVRRRVVDLCRRAGLKVLTVPSFDDILRGHASVAQVREVELDDLLGRDPVVLDTSGLRDFLQGRTIVVTGAGGSIGSELCRQIVRFAPARLVLFEQSEFALYRIHDELSSVPGACELIPMTGDVKDRGRLQQVFASLSPHVVFHAAAYKHVPLMEERNAWEAVRNNALGTLTTLRAADAAGVGAFVLVSTDKAVNPTNVMGASKRLAELLCLGLPRRSRMKVVMVRFGNVLGSTGSVVPKFRRQIAAGGPVTVTHPDMTRYFMSIAEAAQLVLQAGMMGAGGEIFVLDMGEPVKIVDLAREMIRLSGLAEEDIRIVFTGLRPGEKLFEEVLADHEQTLPTPHPKLRVARSTRALDDVAFNELVRWLEQDRQLDDAAVRASLGRWVPEYAPGGAAGAARDGEPSGSAAVIKLPAR